MPPQRRLRDHSEIEIAAQPDARRWGYGRYGYAGDQPELLAGTVEARRALDTCRATFGQMDDAAIMLELSAGNMAGFDFLIQKYRKPIIHFMYRMVHNQAVAEELAQEVFLRVYRSRETYRAEARFSTWLYRIATNLGVNHARDTRHERTASTVYLDEPDAETGTTPDVADTTPGAEADLLRQRAPQRHPPARHGAARAPAHRRPDAQVRRHGLQADRRRPQAQRVRHQIAALPRVPDPAREVEAVCLEACPATPSHKRERFGQKTRVDEATASSFEIARKGRTRSSTMMNCKTCQAVLPDLLLDPGACRSGDVQLRAHLAACADCAR